MVSWKPWKQPRPGNTPVEELLTERAMATASWELRMCCCGVQGRGDVIRCDRCVTCCFFGFNI